jgi:acetylornithine/succinyldiaminopimelate/putrescine aminotransferase
MSSINNRQLFFSHLAQTSDKPIGIEVASAKGIYIYDYEGKAFIDMISGFSVCNIGHSHPAVIKAIQDQAEQYMHVIVYGEFIQSPQVQYAKALTSVLPDNLQSVYFTNSGAEAAEGAMKLAKRVTKRTKMISFQGAYHGSTQGALSMMGEEYFKNAFRPLLPEVMQLRYNNFDDLHLIDNTVACVLVELIQAETGITPANKDWVIALKEKCESLCVVLIVDEIQSGFGRTGSLFAFEQYGITPDILLLGKALGGGLPLGAFIAGVNMMGALTHSPVLGHITTFGGNPVCCAAGNAAFQILQQSKWINEIAKKEQFLLDQLVHSSILKRSHKGLWMSLQFSSIAIAKKVAACCISNGIITDWFLFAEDKIRIAPPLSITLEELSSAVQKIKLSIDEAVASI